MKQLVLLITTLVISCGGSQQGAKVDKCKDFELDVRKTEIAGIRARVDIAVKQFGGEIDVHRGEEIITQMDNNTRKWVMERYAVCRDHFHREIGTREEYQARVTCLDAVFEQQTTLITALEAGDTGALERVTAIAGEISQCIN